MDLPRNGIATLTLKHRSRLPNLESQEQGCVNPASAASASDWTQAQLETLGATTAQALPVDQLSPASLAYLGDAVYELYVRNRYLWPPKRICDYHQRVVSRVRAETQAAQWQRLEPHLTTAELDLARRGRNAASKRPRRLSPEIYQQATRLETLVGYLFLTDPQRLLHLLTLLNWH